MLDTELIRNFPPGNRTFPFSWWEKITLNYKLNINSSEWYPTESDINQFILEEIKYDSNIKDQTKSKVIDIGYASRDFNIDAVETPIKLLLDEDDNWNSNLSEVEIPFLSFIHKDLLLITSKPNENGWFEAFKANDKDRSIGITHINFVNFLNFKLS